MLYFNLSNSIAPQVADQLLQLEFLIAKVVNRGAIGTSQLY